MTLVLLILAVIWAAVLIPPMVRSRAESRPHDSVVAFHQQLAVLGRAGPQGSRSNPGWPPPANPSPPLSQRPLSQRHVSLVDQAPRPLAYPTLRGVTTASVRRTARQRRRDVFMALLVAAGTTLVLGAIPALRMLWLVHVAADVLLIAYVALLVRQRNLATERAMKVRLLPTARRHEPGLEAEGRWLDTDNGWLGRPEPVLLRRSAN